jgi:hypothetical protein
MRGVRAGGGGGGVACGSCKVPRDLVLGWGRGTHVRAACPGYAGVTAVSKEVLIHVSLFRAVLHVLR